LPGGGAGANLVGVYPVREVSVVSPNEDGKDSAVEQM